ncbi:MAG: 1-acyl-sn-glycerol-3-phosphate acyltransferase [Sphaerochaetaceae bacterium]|nr:1-acyl-sn-glycerol-3-phosphate acyltransferase [Sphaerochaetaceae bacterium]
MKNARGPAVVLSNHTSSFDQFIACHASRRRMTYVLSDALYYTRSYSWVFSSLHLVHKQQFFTSISDIKYMKEVIKNNGILLIFPTGVISTCGKGTEPFSATGKFLKMLQADTYVIREHGMYLTNPKWQEGIRTGKPETEIFRLFSAEELKSQTAEDIQKKITEALNFNDYEWQESKMVEYKNGSDIHGLENVLHSCPECNSHFSIENIDNTLTCTKCGFTTRADNYGFLTGSHFKYPSSWESALHNSLKTSIRQDPGFSYSSKVSITRLDKKQRKFVKMEDGTATVTMERIKVKLVSGAEIYNESTSSFPTLPMVPGSYFELQDGKSIFRCFPEEKKDAAYITDIVMCISEIKKGM